MRILTEIPDEDVKELDAIARRDGKSRAAVLREAISNYLAVGAKEGFEKYFGLWERHGSTVDGLDYERNLRGEWPDVSDHTLPKNKQKAA
jgi:Ribbon-helix-helix protein, copG family